VLPPLFVALRHQCRYRRKVVADRARLRKRMQKTLDYDGLCAGQAPERILAGLTPHVRGKLGSLARNEAVLAPYRRQLDLLETIPSIARVSAHALLAECAHGAARTKRSQFHGLHATL